MSKLFLFQEEDLEYCLQEKKEKSQSIFDYLKEDHKEFPSFASKNVNNFTINDQTWWKYFCYLYQQKNEKEMEKVIHHIYLKYPYHYLLWIALLLKNQNLHSKYNYVC